MDLKVFVALAIEAVIFLIPFCKLWFTVGSWKKEVDLRIQNTLSSISLINDRFSELSRNMLEISNQLAVISAKVGLIIDDKIKGKKE